MINKVLSIIKKEVDKYDLPLAESVNEEFSDPFKVLVSTILSARTRDEITEKVNGGA